MAEDLKAESTHSKILGLKRKKETNNNKRERKANLVCHCYHNVRMQSAYSMIVENPTWSHASAISFKFIYTYTVSLIFFFTTEVKRFYLFLFFRKT